MKPLSHYVSFFFLLLLVGGMAILAIWLANVSDAWVHYSLVNLIFFFVVTVASFILFYKSYTKKNSVLIAVVGSFLGKLLLSAVLVLILKQYWTLEILPFFIPFALSYLLFTIPEVIILVKLGDALSRQKEQNEDKS